MLSFKEKNKKLVILHETYPKSTFGTVDKFHKFFMTQTTSIFYNITISVSSTLQSILSLHYFCFTSAANNILLEYIITLPTVLFNMHSLFLCPQILVEFRLDVIN